jgi:hypothetical protein
LYAVAGLAPGVCPSSPSRRSPDRLRTDESFRREEEDAELAVVSCPGCRLLGRQRWFGLRR